VPWKAKNPMDLKLEFITRLRHGERMTDLCREYGIARKTGHKLKNRYNEQGALGLFEQSRAPKYIPHKTTPELEGVLLAERRAHPTWGAKKLKDVLERRLGHDLPSASTIGNVLERHGLVERRKRRRRHESAPTLLRPATAPNAVWCVDYKGQFRLGDKSYCYPLTVTDQFSRYILGCEAMPAISDEAARYAFEGIFESYGLPDVLRSDNGAPFASTGLGGLTQLSAYWLRLGITLERIRPAHPQDNARHERMHRTLKRETTRPARANLLKQQDRFESFVEEFNTERPHEGIGMKRPAELYERSSRAYPDRLPELTYPEHDDVLTVDRKGSIRPSWRRKVHLTRALTGHSVGIREENDGRWLVTFSKQDLAHLDADGTLTPITSTLPEVN
jgi:transposase InsO family protein